MDFAFDQSKAVLSKSLSLIQKSINQLKQLDGSSFPSDSSEVARQMLLDVFHALQDPSNFIPMDCDVLHKQVMELQKCIEILKQSSAESISWPFVGYCDEIWAKFFHGDWPKLFYSVTSDHNYSIFNFSNRVFSLVQDLLTKEKIADLMRDRKLFCLQLASVENDNLPLYALIGHEFGHAVYTDKSDTSQDIYNLIKDNFGNVLKIIYSSFQSDHPHQAARINPKIYPIICSIAKELFCDLVGAKLMGPAFLLSLFEISWDHNDDMLTVTLPENIQFIRAYPSFRFRLYCIKTFFKIGDFCKSAKVVFMDLKGEDRKRLAECLSSIPDDHSQDRVIVYPATDPDAPLVKSALTTNMKGLKDACENYVKEASDFFDLWYPGCASSVIAADVAALLKRLENNIIPNILPDPANPLLGKPADLPVMLTASALYRMSLLVHAEHKNLEADTRESGKIERLAAKAYEATYIQRKYTEWKAEQDGCAK
jgi:hypothetical protein